MLAKPSFKVVLHKLSLEINKKSKTYAIKFRLVTTGGLELQIFYELCSYQVISY